ncbi:Gram-negative bacterial tonB protein [Caballeronia udeis]|uniref:Gram-negative bacterial tonB protein n=2 Tax=Caballeronia udeis TaxID=1232866 RepID=A0A158I9K2_9BURK|nr:Gram-negative bacterial tonB protein [Caballeronia udeis]
MGKREGRMDASQVRFGVALLIAFALWAVLLTQIVNPLLRPLPSAATPPQAPMEMRLVELAAPPANPPAVAPSTPSAAVTQQAHARRDPTPIRVVKRQEIQRPRPEPVMARTDQPAPPAPPQANAAATSTAAATTSSSSASASNMADASAGSAARVISQPMPPLPDDLREDAYQAVAVARFDIHPDGTIEVELSKPTQNPRLNALLLETLRKWRFFPAMQGGHPVESHQDVRVHFNVS